MYCKLSFIPIFVFALVHLSVVSASADPGSSGGGAFNFEDYLVRLRAAMEAIHRDPEDINHTVEYLGSLDPADAAALHRFDPLSRALVGGVASIGFRWVVATVVPNGFAAMHLTPEDMRLYEVGMPRYFRVLNLGTVAPADGENWARLRDLIGRTDFGMAAFWKEIIGHSIYDYNILETLVSTLIRHPADEPPIDHAILADIKINLRAKTLEGLMGWAHQFRTEFATSGFVGDVGPYIFTRFWNRLHDEAVAINAAQAAAREVHAGPHIA